MTFPKLRIRRWFMVGITIAILGVFVARLIQIQIVEGEAYANMLNPSNVSSQTVKAIRGEVVDRNGKPLAVNRMGYDVILDRAYLSPDKQNDIILELIGLFERLGETWTDTLPITATAPFAFREEYESEIARLKKLLGAQSYASAENAVYWLVQRYKLEDYSPEDQRKIAGVRYEMEQRGFNWNVPYTFATDINISSVIQVKERSYQLQGVEVEESGVRYYPNGNLAPHLIGNIGPIYAEEYPALKEKGYAMDDRVGNAGVEKAFEDLLRGTNGLRQIQIGQGGEVVQVVENPPPVAGKTVVLTLDNDLQLIGQEALEKQIAKLQATAPAGQGREAEAGAVVAVEVKTGEVLVAATYPSYDLNTFSQEYSKLAAQELRPMFNRAVQGTYAPGSTFKPVVGMAGLTHGVIEEGSNVHCGRVYTFYAPGYQPTCLGYHGGINVVGALRVSCNIFFYDVGRRVGIENIVDMAAQLGLGQPTGIEIPEALGQISSPEAKAADPYNDEAWFPGDVLQSSIGQMYNWYSPLQMANYAATLGNRGTRMKLTLVHEVRDYAMNQVLEPFTPVVAATVDAPREAFETVVEGMVAASGPSGTASATFGYYPITVASKTGTPETRDLPNSVFICFAPAEDPEIAVAVIIEKGWHGYTGAPVAKEIFNEYFGLNVSGAAQAEAQSAATDEEPAASPSSSLPEPAAPAEEISPPADTTSAAGAESRPE